MQDLLNTLSFTLPEFICIAVIPILLVLFTIIYAIIANSKLNKLSDAMQIIEEQLSSDQNTGDLEFTTLSGTAEHCENEEIKNAINRLIKKGENRYASKWLPDPKEELQSTILSENSLPQAQNYTAALLVFVIGLLSTIALALMAHLTPDFVKVQGFLYFLSLLTGGMMALILINQKKNLANNLDQEINFLSKEIAEHYPVYTDKESMALLVNEMTGHEERLNLAMTDFNKNVEKFISDDFKNTVGDSIRQIMQEEVAPPINKSSDVLSELAVSLKEQQDQGMTELANTFSEKLSQSLASNFRGVTEELGSFNALIEDTTNFIHDSIAILENSRQQNILLNREIAESIELMTVAKNDIANEMAKMSDYLEVVANVTEKMTSVYAGEDANLKSQIGSLETAMKNSLSTINESITQSQSTMTLSSQLKDTQNQQYDQTVEKMNELLANLTKINANISQSTEKFAVDSNDKVDQALKGFEQALANIVERLIYTTAEIKDAVEGLPLAIKAKDE